MKYLFLILIFFTSLSIAQTVSFTPTYHFGSYGENTTEFGTMEPTLDWEISLYVPITEKFAVTPSVYYYFANYKDRIFEQQPLQPNITFYETFWYFGISFEYTFSEEPLF